MRRTLGDREGSESPGSRSCGLSPILVDESVDGPGPHDLARGTSSAPGSIIWAAARSIPRCGRCEL